MHASERASAPLRAGAARGERRRRRLREALAALADSITRASRSGPIGSEHSSACWCVSLRRSSVLNVQAPAAGPPTAQSKARAWRDKLALNSSAAAGEIKNDTDQELSSASLAQVVGITTLQSPACRLLNYNPQEAATRSIRPRGGPELLCNDEARPQNQQNQQQQLLPSA